METGFNSLEETKPYRNRLTGQLQKIMGVVSIYAQFFCTDAMHRVSYMPMWRRKALRLYVFGTDAKLCVSTDNNYFTLNTESSIGILTSILSKEITAASIPLAIADVFLGSTTPSIST